MSVPYGKYQLLKKIGSGGMGQVFLARHEGDQGFEKLVVIKRILPHLAEDEDFLTMFFDEARIAARLNHPNLVQIFDLGEANRTQYLAMEYVQGEDLRKLDRFSRTQNTPLPLGATLRIIADAAAGLDYAHKARDAQGKPLGLVHRDVSPQNILVGFDGAVKLIDFGVAKAAGRVQHTGTGVLKGKYPYMSPEQAEGRELDARSDIFSLGVVLWEILTGKRLFKAESDLATMRLVVDCQVPAPSKINPKLPPGLDAVVLQALGRAPEQRYRDAAAFRLAIEDFLLAQRLAASSAHLTAYLTALYAQRIAWEANPENLDEYNDGMDPDVDHTPSQSTPGSRANWRQGRAPSASHPAAQRPGSKSTPAVKSSAKATPLPVKTTSSASNAARAGAPQRPTHVPAPQRHADDAEPGVPATKFTASLPDNLTPPAQRRSQVWIGGAITAAVLLTAAAAILVREPLSQTPSQVSELKPVVPRTVATPVPPPAAKPAPVEVPPAPVEPERPAAVVVKLASEPSGANVEIDGRTVGRTPLEYALEDQGSVVAVFSMQGFEPQQATVTAAQAPELSVRLARKRNPPARRPPPGPLGIKTDR